MDDEQALLVALELRMTKYERDFEKTIRKTDSNFKTMEKRAQVSGQRMEKHLGDSASAISDKLQGMFATLSKGGFAVAAIAGTALAFKEIASSVAEVDREARKAGVSAKVWQQWSGVAVATGMTIDGVTDALKELNIRGDEFATTGGGSAMEAFKRLGYSATDVAERLKDPNRFIDEIIGKLQQLDTAAQTRILDEVFGGTGAEQLAKVLGKSVTEIQKMRAEAALFSDEQIESAKKIDAEFATMWRNVMVNAKAAAIEGVGYAKQIIGALQGNFLPGYDEAKGNVARLSSSEAQLKRLQARRAEILADIDREKANTGNFLQASELRSLETALKAVDDEIHKATGGSKEFKEVMKELSAATNSLSGGFDGNVTSAANFKTALNELKSLVPELKAELDTLAQSGAVDAAYLKTMRSARTMSEAMGVTDIANRAKTVVRVDAATSEPTKYLEAALSDGKGKAHIEGMASEFAKKLATMLASVPENLKGDITINSGYRSVERQQQLWIDALKKYGSPEAARKWVAPPGNSQHNKGNAADLGYSSDASRKWAHENAGNFGLQFPLSNENWHIEDADARKAADNQKVEPTAGQQATTALLEQQTAARKSLNMTVQESLALAQFEQSVSGMSVSQQRVELEIFRLKQDAARQGITLSASEIAAMREKITVTEQLNAKNQDVATSAEGLRSAQEYFAQGFTSSLSGLLAGTTTLQGALQSLTSSLIDAVLQASLLGKGPLASLFGFGGTGAASGILGAILGFDDGGFTGEGGKHEPAGIVHKGEFVMSKAATSRLGVGNLDALHKGALRGFAGLKEPKSRQPKEPIPNAGYSAGGFVGDGGRDLAVVAATGYGSTPPTVGAPPAIRQPEPKGANNNTPAITINAPISVAGSAGTPEQNDDLAKKMQKRLEATMRGVVADELRIQMRPGNVLSGRR